MSMDPDEVLRLLRAAITDYRGADSWPVAHDAADRIADHVEALDGWMTVGGFVPLDWRLSR